MSQSTQKSRRAGRSITVTDLARAAGVSRSTVSLVLRSSPLVRRETGRRVEEAIDRLGYVYNRNAANLRRRTSDMVAMVINDLTNPFFAELAVGVDDALQAAGYVSLMANTNEDPGRQRRVMESMREHGAAGVILCPAMGTGTRQAVALTNWNAPVVQVMRRLPGARLGTVVPDNRLGARMAAERLLSLGHRRIAFLGGSDDNVVTAERAGGYRAALDAAGVAVDPALVVPATLNRGGGVEALRRVLAAPAPADGGAVFQRRRRVRSAGRPGRSGQGGRSRLQRHRLRRRCRRPPHPAAAHERRGLPARARTAFGRSAPAAHRRSRRAARRGDNGALPGRARHLRSGAIRSRETMTDTLGRGLAGAGTTAFEWMSGATRDAVPGGSVGTPVAARVFHAVHLAPLRRTRRAKSPETGGGMILDTTVRDADPLRFVLDVALAVRKATARGTCVAIEA